MMIFLSREWKSTITLLPMVDVVYGGELTDAKRRTETRGAARFPFAAGLRHITTISHVVSG